MDHVNISDVTAVPPTPNFFAARYNKSLHHCKTDQSQDEKINHFSNVLLSFEQRGKTSIPIFYLLISIPDSACNDNASKQMDCPLAISDFLLNKRKSIIVMKCWILLVQVAAVEIVRSFCQLLIQSSKGGRLIWPTVARPTASCCQTQPVPTIVL